jgi:type II secretory pathway predicted ATPase ExeA
MQPHGISLADKAFGEQADSALIVAYESHQDALRFLAAALSQANGIVLLQGPGGSGKSTIVREQLAWTGRDAAVAIVDGVHLSPRQLLQSVLGQFGVAPIPLHDEQMLQAVNKFATQQKRNGHAPLIVIDNVDRATPSTLRLLNWLAALDVQGGFALRLVLTGREPVSALFHNDSTRSITRRNPATYALNPMSSREATLYLRTRLLAAGGTRIEKAFPLDVCEQLHQSSLGWPGALNMCAFERLQLMAEKQGSKPVPRVIVTSDGETVAEYELTERKYAIGRGDLADIITEDSYVSKMHAMLQVYRNALVLHDLNSTNGTTVNSVEIQKTVLRSNDIITLGGHRLKIENAPAIGSEMDEKIRAADTLTLQNFADIRRLRAQHTIAALKHK